MRGWGLVKDILLTGTGMALIISQVFSPAPSDVLLVTGLALTIPSVAGHAGSLLAGRPGEVAGRRGGTGGASSPPSPPPGPPPSPSSPAEATRD